MCCLRHKAMLCVKAQIQESDASAWPQMNVFVPLAGAVCGDGYGEKEHLILSAVPVRSCGLNRQWRTRSTDVLLQTGINLYIQS